mmetsp:Transcript_40403/g.45540  ORF Transcript_40403/g.45540 Transcript_40403/m.45540 type:complete len:221 (+) Transcript_40403:286-948(+)
MGIMGHRSQHHTNRRLLWKKTNGHGHEDNKNLADSVDVKAILTTNVNSLNQVEELHIHHHCDKHHQHQKHHHQRFSWPFLHRDKSRQRQQQELQRCSCSSPIAEEEENKVEEEQQDSSTTAKKLLVHHYHRLADDDNDTSNEEDDEAKDAVEEIEEGCHLSKSTISFFEIYQISNTRNKNEEAEAEAEQQAIDDDLIQVFNIETKKKEQEHNDISTTTIG